jgi:ketosteroid isomerase-like protein
MNQQTLQVWLDKYVQAWKTYDEQLIRDLFSEDATYAFSPFDTGDDVVRGREAIVANWLEETDAPGSWEARYTPVAVEGNVGVANGRTRYIHPDGTLEGEFDNIFVLHFDDTGRCTSFVEWYMQPRTH